jgi:hypothetical protein
MGQSFTISNDLSAQSKEEPVAQAAEWRVKLKEWRRWMTTITDDPAGQNSDTAIANIRAIDDPTAIPVILALLKNEKNARVRRALIEPLISLGGPEAVEALVVLSVEDANPVLRERAAEGLVRKPELEKYRDRYIKYLGSPKHASAAAVALRLTRLAAPVSTVEQPEPKLTRALTKAILAKTKKVVPYRVAYDTGWIPHINGEFRSRGYGERMVEVYVPEPNPEVLTTLQEYTGRDYGYDQNAWTNLLRPQNGGTRSGK